MNAPLDEPSPSRLGELTVSSELGDRAFAASVLGLRPRASSQAESAELYARVRRTALAVHADVRACIRAGRSDPKALLAYVERAPFELRDHLVEELLDVAYPPRRSLALPRDGVSYCPSGLDEIRFVVAESGLAPGKTFVDLGSGMGKVALLVALLSGANAVGVELDPDLVSEARAAAMALELGRVEFIEGDLRTVALPRGDVYFMFIAWSRPNDIVARLEPLAKTCPLLLFAQALDLKELPWLKRSGRASYWLERYESALG